MQGEPRVWYVLVRIPEAPGESSADSRGFHRSQQSIAKDKRVFARGKLRKLPGCVECGTGADGEATARALDPACYGLGPIMAPDVRSSSKGSRPGRQSDSKALLNVEGAVGEHGQ